jgi:hypothetical protein
LPRDAGALWDVLLDFNGESRLELFAHCVGLTVNAVHEAYNRRPRALAHASKLADAVQLDMAAAGWAPTVDNYLGRVTKARIVQAVLETRGEQAAQAIASPKKGEMAEKAEELLTGTGWLPEPLRRPGQLRGVSGLEAAAVPDAPTPDREADQEGDVDQPETDTLRESGPQPLRRPLPCPFSGVATTAAPLLFLEAPCRTRRYHLWSFPPTASPDGSIRLPALPRERLSDLATGDVYPNRGMTLCVRSLRWQ